VFFVSGAERIEPPDDLYVTDTFTDRALEFVEEAVTQTKRPFFLYRFGDYWKVGLPLTVVVTAVAIPLILLVWPL
jgi:hypothetical protein